jgi:hypothetical protein
MLWLDIFHLLEALKVSYKGNTLIVLKEKGIWFMKISHIAYIDCWFGFDDKHLGAND